MPLPPPPTILHCTADRRFIGSPFSGCNVTVRSYLPSDHNLCAQSKKLIPCTCHRQITKQRNDTVVKTALPFLKCEFQLTCMYTCKFTVTFQKRQGSSRRNDKREGDRLEQPSLPLFTHSGLNALGSKMTHTFQNSV